MIFLLKIIKSFIKTILTICLILALAVGYAFYVEPELIRKKEITVSMKETAGLEELRLVQFSDTHLGEGFSLKQLKRTVNKINAMNPDFVFFTGDLMDIASQYHEKEEATKLLGAIEAKIEKIAIWGNHDYGGGGVRVYEQMMEKAGFLLLRNESVSYQCLDNGKLYITALDDGMLGRPDYSVKPKIKKGKDKTILALHEPDLAENIDYQPDLILSGHSHGGQVKLPFLGPLVTPPLSRIYTDGLYEREGGSLYVNTGLGTTRIHARFLNLPEITFFQFTK